MSELHPSDRKALLRAGFTEREIATQQRKFCNLTQINPCYTDELKQFEQLQADRRVLLEALKAMEARFGCRSSRQEDQPKTYGCHHTAETCTQCEGLVTGWKAVQAARAAIAKVTGGAQ